MSDKCYEDCCELKPEYVVYVVDRLRGISGYEETRKNAIKKVVVCGLHVPRNASRIGDFAFEMSAAQFNRHVWLP